MSKKNAKILMATTTTRMGGAEKIMHGLISDLQAEFDFEVCYLRREGDLPNSAKSVSWLKILFGHYNIIHTHLFLPGFIARLRRVWDSRFYWIHSVHHADYNGQKGARLKKFLDFKWIFPSADRLITVSRFLQEQLQRFPQQALIENSVDLSPPAPREPLDRPILGTVAMLRPEKGLVEFLRVLSILVAREPNVLWKIAGDGPGLDELRQQIKKIGLENHVEILGYVSDLPAFFSSIRVYVQPSRAETFGLSVLEAMHYGLPVVTSSVGNLPYLLGQGEFGALAGDVADDPDEFARVVTHVLVNCDVYVARAEAGREYFSERFQPQRMTLEYKKLFERSLQNTVCMIATRASHGGGGLEKQLFLQSQELVQSGFNVFVLQAEDHDLLHSVAKQRKWRHVRFLQTPLGFSQFKWTARWPGLLFLLNGLYLLYKNRHRISVVHAHQLYAPALLAAFAKMFWGMPALVKVTASGELGELRELQKLPFLNLRKKLFRYLDRIIVLSEDMKSEVLQLGFRDDQIVLIPNSVESYPVRKIVSRRCLKVLYIGRISKEKSIQTLLEAAALVNSQERLVEIHLVGGRFSARDALPELQALAEKIQDSVSVFFHGAQLQVDSYLKDCDIFVLPSRSEGMSNALLEGLSSGIVCIASDIPVHHEMINHGQNGLLFKVGSPELLAEQIRFIYEDFQNHAGAFSQKLSREAQERIRKVYSPEAIVSRLKGIYRDLEL